ncbi:MAG: formate--tetrahydrofolate ligase [Candidatus Brocadia sp. AMX2]|uniref:Formate--tetrahydrofolate ligase n=1 Tax=Candidatus Brocadia sinica JPN1 TaxID=1197129 RepID=A0ABQ0K063_9BACT|nr:MULTISPECIES: formate--tetrahydrofolate ligase [Brocadia]MBC6932135.1 formate--tetrahydrofolate ligase [Candidatus Brocadia sp.]MBL1169404.1 formate--tetrahydrofolate ligase [Candidatus Brocadia sp. AMX1]MCK6469085.1 formate--tetrahydrofolate ligase [Candidatus Brocadia sinica]NOG42283.1 formate--tetrahydrofolate ligase [Planctomycetota bacterium]KAA0244984.1 MAG: formate--tetrahydrofolate ligase [Candidatus Brocadia sp. AMX2]
MALDPTKHADWEIAEDAEARMKTVYQLADGLGLMKEELLPHGHHVAKIDFNKVLNRVGNKLDGKFIDVTAITPTPLGEGKSTTTIGLVQGLGKREKDVIGTIRQPSGGPTMNIKGSAAGGGLSQCIPLTPFSLGLTGDINAIINAHNLAMVALTSRIQHEFNYDDERLKKSNLKRIDIDTDRIEIKWIIDFCAQALRKIIIGIGGRMDGFMMESGFAIAVSSELMAILSVSKDLKDMRERIGKMVVAYDKKGKPVTTSDLEVAGAMTAWMVEAINPNLMQTIEGQPVFVHAGPFANIAIGQSSIIADRIALKLGDYVVTESGFGADIGFEKFWNLKCRYSGHSPNAAVIVTTVRGMKCHGGAPIPVPGRPLDSCYKEENVAWVEKGTENLVHHIETVRKAGINPVVCINHFHTDTKAEINVIRKIADAAGARVAVSYHWLKGGEGALELADAVIDACNHPTNFKFLYELSTPLKTRIEMIAKEVYGADGVDFTQEALTKIKALDNDPDISKMGTCMVKTHLSVTDNPQLKGAPKNWRLRVRDILTFKGAGFVVPMAGDIKLMPGTSSDPAFRRVDVDVNTGKVKGLF